MVLELVMSVYVETYIPLCSARWCTELRLTGDGPEAYLQEGILSLCGNIWASTVD